MIVKNKEIVIECSDIFANDVLDRKDSIDNLSKIISTTTDPFVLSIDADWGAGKTTFVRLLKAHLEKEYEIQSVYFSAWEEDYSKEPLISILGKINKHISDNFSGNIKLKKLSKLANESTAKVLTRGISAFIKGSTGIDVGSGIIEVVTEFSEKTALDLIESYKKDEDTTKEFKDSIRKLLSSIDSEKSFVIFIDELDRCRPLYSIELLERIKHLFNIDNLTFVLSIDKKQLSESIKSQYGNIDTNNYLRRFIDLEYRLKNPNKDQFCNALFRKYSFDETLKKKDIKRIYTDGHVNLLKHLVKSMDLTLREIEQIFIQFVIFTQTIQLRFYEVHFRVFVLFAALKIKDSEVFLDFSSGKISNQDILKDFFSIVDDDKRYMNIVIKSIVLSAFKNDTEFRDLIDEQEKLLSIDETEEQRIMVRELKKDEDEWYHLNQVIETVVRKLEFTDQFNFETDDSKIPL